MNENALVKSSFRMENKKSFCLQSETKKTTGKFEYTKNGESIKKFNSLISENVEKRGLAHPLDFHFSYY